MVAGSIGYTVQAFARLGDAGRAAHVASATTPSARTSGARSPSRASTSRWVVDAHGGTAIAIYMMLFGGHKRPMTYRLPAFEPWPDPLPMVRPGEPRPDLVHCGGLLHFPGMWHRGLAAAFATARAAGVMTAIDPQFPLVDTPAPWLPHVADALSEADVLLCDDGELRRLFAIDDLRQGIAAAHAAGPRRVVVKRGARGALASDGGSVVDQPAVAIAGEQLRESVGAGDAFDAGLLDTLVRGGDLARATRFGTAAAALTLGGRGGAESIADRDAVAAWLPRVPNARTWRGD